MGNPWAWAGRWEPPLSNPRVRIGARPPGFLPLAVFGQQPQDPQQWCWLLQGASVLCQRQEERFLALLQPLPSRSTRTKPSLCPQQPEVQEMLVLGGWWGPVCGAWLLGEAVE